MWKGLFLSFLVLGAVISAMMFWQWNAYSKQSESSETKETARQELTIETKQDQLFVTQTIKGLSAGKEYRTVKTEKLFRWECLGIEGKGCSSSDEDPSTFISEDGSLTFEYTIPVKASPAPFLLTDWTTILPDVQMADTLTVIVDSSRRSGGWAAGGRPEGYKQGELIDYYVFERDGGAPAVFWQPDKLNTLASADNFILLSSAGKETALTLEAEKVKKVADLPFLTLIQTDSYKEAEAGGLMIIHSDAGQDELMVKILSNALHEKFSGTPAGETWLLDIAASAALAKEPSSEKAKKILAGLKKVLGEEGMEEFFSWIKSSDTFSAELLDRFLGSKLGRETGYFSLNKDEKAPYIPFYFTDKRKIEAYGTESGIKAIGFEGKTYFPFIQTAGLLGYKAEKVSGKEIFLKGAGNNSYRFYLDKNIFIYNEEDYGLLENPLVTVGSELFMDRHWLEALFKVKVAEEENMISIEKGE
jgi:hypothetical protein